MVFSALIVSTAGAVESRVSPADSLHDLWGEPMKFLLWVLAIALMTASAQAQTSTGQGGGRQKSHHQDQTQKSATPKADDKAYNAALRGLPNKPYDPWSGAR